MEFVLLKYRNICPPIPKKAHYNLKQFLFFELQNLRQGVFGVGREVKEGNRFHRNYDFQGSVLFFVTTFFFFFKLTQDANMHS